MTMDNDNEQISITLDLINKLPMVKEDIDVAVHFKFMMDSLIESMEPNGLRITPEFSILWSYMTAVTIERTKSPDRMLNNICKDCQAQMKRDFKDFLVKDMH